MRDDDMRPNTGLEHIQQAIRDKENDIADLAFDIEVSRAIAEIHAMPAWVRMTATLRDAVAAETEKLLSGRMDEYNLGRRQGRIKSMRTLLVSKPLDKPDLDQKVSSLTLLRTELDELRQLLL